MVSHSKYPPESRNLGCQTSAYAAYAVLSFVARFVQSLGLPNIPKLPKKPNSFGGPQLLPVHRPKPPLRASFTIYLVQLGFQMGSQWKNEVCNLEWDMWAISKWKFTGNVPTMSEVPTGITNIVNWIELGNGSTAKNLSNLVVQTGCVVRRSGP